MVAALDASADDPVKPRLNTKIIELALLLARLQDGSPILVHAWQPFAEKLVSSHATDEELSKYLDSSRRRVKQELGRLVESVSHPLAGVRLELRRGDVDDVIPSLS